SASTSLGRPNGRTHHRGHRELERGETPVSKFFKALEQAERDRARREAQVPGVSHAGGRPDASPAGPVTGGDAVLVRPVSTPDTPAPATSTPVVTGTMTEWPPRPASASQVDAS